MNFALILFLATVLTGAVALADRLHFAGRRAEGAHVFDYILITKLLKTDDRISGCLGYQVHTGEFYMFKAKKNYKRLVFELHPDRTGNDPTKTELFKLLGWPQIAGEKKLHLPTEHEAD
jgi:hypothetical protein